MFKSILLLMLGLSVVPFSVDAQHPIRVASVEALSIAARCAAEPRDSGPMWNALLDIVTLEENVARRRLLSLQDSVSSMAAQTPGDVESQFLVAAVLGARSEVEGGRSKVRVAEALLSQLQVVLALDPSHPGALHLLGRLHASVMRLDGLTRFVATRLLGGDKLRSASWEEAERLLLTAIGAEPCTGDHYYQLARVYADRGMRSEARQRLAEVLDLGPDGSRDPRVWNATLVLLEDVVDRR